MMFGISELSTAAGCAQTSGTAATHFYQQQRQQHQKLPKARYGSYFNGMGDDADSDDAQKVRRRMKRAEQKRRRDEDGEHQGVERTERKTLSKRLLGKLVKILTVKDLSFLPSGKTFPSRDSKKAKRHQQQQHQRSHNSSQSSAFEPMPTIMEETESELYVEQEVEAMQQEDAQTIMGTHTQQQHRQQQQQQFTPREFGSSSASSSFLANGPLVLQAAA